MVAKFKRFKKGVAKSSLFSYFLLALILGITGFLIFSAMNINQKRVKIIQDIRSLQEQIRDLEQRKENLQANISAVNTSLIDRFSPWEYNQTTGVSVLIGTVLVLSMWNSLYSSLVNPKKLGIVVKRSASSTSGDDQDGNRNS